MVTSRNNTSNPARIPALGLRTLALVFLSILLMFLDNRDNHLNTFRNLVSSGVYPLRLLVDSPSRLWDWIDTTTQSRNEIQLENSRLRTEQLLTRARLREFSS